LAQSLNPTALTPKAIVSGTLRRSLSSVTLVAVWRCSVIAAWRHRWYVSGSFSGRVRHLRPCGADAVEACVDGGPVGVHSWGVPFAWAYRAAEPGGRSVAHHLL